jgi:glutamate--cysteine ligase
MAAVGQLLDHGHREAKFIPAIEQQRKKVADPAATPSARILDELGHSRQSFADYALGLSEQHAARFRARRLNARKRERFEEMAVASLNDQQRIEAEDTLSFDEFLQRYFSQT